jgi:hypothetical protein
MLLVRTEGFETGETLSASAGLRIQF